MYRPKCMYVCMCMYVCIYVWTYINIYRFLACIHLYTHTPTYARTNIRRYTYIHKNATHNHRLAPTPASESLASTERSCGPSMTSALATVPMMPVYICACVYMFLCVCVYIYVYTYTYNYIYIHTCISIYKHEYTTIRSCHRTHDACVYMCVYIYLRVCACIYIYVCTYMFMYIYI